MRYNNTNKAKDNNNKLYYSPSFVSNIPLKDSDIFVPVSEGARFDMLAQKYYGDSNLWWIIAKANGYSHESRPKPGDRIRIPRNISVILDEFKRINTKR